MKQPVLFHSALTLIGLALALVISPLAGATGGGCPGVGPNCPTDQCNSIITGPGFACCATSVNACCSYTCKTITCTKKFANSEGCSPTTPMHYSNQIIRIAECKPTGLCGPTVVDPN